MKKLCQAKGLKEPMNCLVAGDCWVSLPLPFLLSRSMFWRNAVAGSIVASVYCYIYEAHPYYPFLLAGGAVFLFLVLGFLFDPLVYITTHDKFQSGATRRRTGNIPPVYPNGWYVKRRIEARKEAKEELDVRLWIRWVVMHSHELKRGNARPVEFMGHSLVAFRGENDVVSVFDAYCPHLGANLGVESKVVGNQLECPFHGWRFNQEGKCERIPGQSMIPESAQLRKWHVVDVNDKIVVWHHADQKAPEWEVEDFVEDFEFHGKTEHTVQVHVQEIAENGPDVSHLNFLHRSWLGSKISTWVHHIWDASWTPGTAENGDQHLAYITVSQCMASFGRPIPFTKNTVRILQVGPGMVHLDFPLPFGLHVRIMENVTPAAPMLQRVRHSIYASRCTPRIFAKIFLILMTRIFEQDVAIWNNKTYQAKPLYAKPDRAIPVYRRWYQQFYSESSPKAAQLLNPLEW